MQDVWSFDWNIWTAVVLEQFDLICFLIRSNCLWRTASTAFESRVMTYCRITNDNGSGLVVLTLYIAHDWLHRLVCWLRPVICYVSGTLSGRFEQEFGYVIRSEHSVSQFLRSGKPYEFHVLGATEISICGLNYCETETIPILGATQLLPPFMSLGLKLICVCHGSHGNHCGTAISEEPAWPRSHCSDGSLRLESPAVRTVSRSGHCCYTHIHQLYYRSKIKAGFLRRGWVHSTRSRM
jgi:hypothetical protein